MSRQPTKMRRRDFRTSLMRLHNITRAQFDPLFSDHHDADKAWILFQRSPVDFYVNADDQLHEALWNLVRC